MTKVKLKVRESFLDVIAKEHHSYSSSRRQVNALSNDALSLSKRAIFSLHRDDIKTAAIQLKQAEKKFAAAEKLMRKLPKLSNEGAYKAALEEHAEAQLFFHYIKTGKIEKLPKRLMDPKIALGGLSDFSGEVARHAVRQATKGNIKEVEKAHQVVEKVVGYLLELDLTGHLRQKFDQAKRNLRAMEQIAYEQSLRD